jgi:RNA polymerase sigma-70 factor (ECF subfamily)
MDSGTQIRSLSGIAQHASGGCAARRERADRAAALAAFAQVQHQSLVRFLTQRVGSRDAARDIAQCAYLKVLSVERPGAIRELDRYVWRSALNLTTDWLPRRAVQVDYARCQLGESARLAPSVETALEARECLEVMARAFESLSVRCQEAYRLRVLQERPFKAVGQAMGISDRMAKIYVARAQLSMRDALERAEG